MCEELSYQINNTSAFNQAAFLLLLEVCKNHYRKENTSVSGSTQRRDALFLNSFKRDLAKRIYITLSFTEFLNIHFFQLV